MKHMNLNSRGGTVLAVIISMLVAIGFATTTFFIKFDAASSTKMGLFAQKRNQYEAEGVLILATRLTQDYLGSTNAPTAEALKAALSRDLPSYLPLSAKVENLIATVPSNILVPAPIANGPFRGIVAPQTTVSLSFDLHSSEGSEFSTVNRLQSVISLAQLSMFQFLYFIDLGYADFKPGPDTYLNGRMHSNGDLCFNADSNLKISKITSATRVMYGSSTECRYRETGENIFISSSTELNNPFRLQEHNDHGCTKCGVTQMAWQEYAPATWNGNLLDSAHGVLPLTLPVPKGIQTQLGANDDDPWVGWANDKNIRFILDPITPSDSNEMASQKFAYKADLRVVAGVWYLRDPSNALRWPGIPIWSDHPGSTEDQWGNKVGQDDLRTAWSAANPWPTGATPRRYSYYEYDSTTRSLGTDNTGIISYGTLFTDTTSAVPTRRPGHWLLDTRRHGVCPLHTPPAPPFVLTSTSGLVDAFKPMNCSSPGSPGVATALLNGTRGGIHDGHIRRLYPIASDARGKANVLPLNFDLEQFQQALLDTSPGELGSYFGAGRFIDRQFNGIIFISTTWPGSNRGFNPVDTPVPAPIQGVSVSATNNVDANQVGLLGPVQQALPYPLCSDPAAVAGAVGAGEHFDRFDNGGTQDAKFKIPSCDSYSMRGGAIQAYPTHIRLINSHNLAAASLPKGLSLVSNQGLYITGGFNTAANTSSATSTPWLPALVAADQITFLSNAWSDANSHWEDDAHSLPRVAASTTYNLATITGWVRSQNSMRLSSFPTLMEDWSSQLLSYTGSIVIGFYPVYERYGRYWKSDGYTYRAGARNIKYDLHYQSIQNQPPGVPLFFNSAVLDWKAE